MRAVRELHYAGKGNGTRGGFMVSVNEVDVDKWCVSPRETYVHT